jgi:CheY-like chemotaxis protein
VRRRRTETQDEQAVTMSKGNLPPILVVDDNHDNAEIIRQYLEIRGYPITVAHSGDEALGVFETVRPALVLLDVMMPGRDGWEVCRVMKQHPTLGRSVRIVMVTALDEWQDKREALQIGADDYVEKPFDLPTLAATVQRNLAMQQAKAS